MEKIKEDLTKQMNSQIEERILEFVKKFENDKISEKEVKISELVQVEVVKVPLEPMSAEIKNHFNDDDNVYHHYI